ncbi:MAG: Fe-S cluster assembly transcriptional regulator IscR [Marinomonas foliarum]|jgi:Rrf2 family transcriptional regulator, iron-sulfur cluster assembly transcription factor|uniref:BadM/Rrf2 family transcriptional regulator n=1 Tax=Marinomonas foliarum TaxID=491950 RepID=A0A369A8W6_9GAMM|nr:Fe-S cluster assembly transcriptional regulator IscR [Marinomonas foliarum]QRV24759.1 Fe-S cluster assembly transcriptional regulator IscR [Marinomonas foliarum]RCX05769.1 BadM/Rrf2 family transcriptional regulator [Marinomonas foliarum]
MRLTTKGRYAVTAMLDLALHSDKGPVSLSDISSRQGISLSYLEQLFSKLRKRSLVNSVRGPGGGYRLSRSNNDIFVAQIVDAVNESVDATGCKGRSDCQSGNTCLTHHLWCDLSDQIHDFLNQISLDQLVRRNDVRQVAERQELESRQRSFENDKISAAIVD